jgi:hydroxymethylpyrimidine/phosphomethylpyrimidine kinase
VQGVHCPPPSFLAQQLDSVLGDLPPAAIKTGMLPDAAAVAAVAASLRHHCCGGSGGSGGGGGGSGGGGGGGGARQRRPPLVVDPVLVSTSGHSLARSGVTSALKQHLLPLATLVTPNIREAEALWGERPGV